MPDDSPIVYLANIGLDGEGVSFRELAEEPTFYGEHLVSGLPLPRGHDPWFTVRAEGDECVVEWVATHRETPFPGGARRLRLRHGEVFRLPPDGVHLVYVEPAGEEWEEARGGSVSYDARSLAALDGWSDEERRAAVHRFLGLPYVGRSWGREFIRLTSFVQYRDGKVPCVRAGDVLRDGRLCRVTFEIAVLDAVRHEWTNGPTCQLGRNLLPHDLDVLVSCATTLAAIPVRQEAF